jgi:starch phosphorylase
MLPTFLHRSLPEGLDAVYELALDLRWMWSHEGDQLWSAVNPALWVHRQNPWPMLQSVSRVDLERLAQNSEFMEELRRLADAHQQYLNRAGWFRENYADGTLGPVAYFSMEFGLGEALPLYAGGLGVLAGDYLKTASDLHVPLVGIGLLYQEGYFRQILDSSGWQLEAYPYNDPTSLPIRPVIDASGGWLRVSLELPGRILRLRVWQVQAGCVTLYLLDSNDPLNSPADRGITNKLYDDHPEIRLMQEMILGIGGCRVLGALGIPAEVCHLNEGHAAFAVLERARDFMQRTEESFAVALCATRAGNVFTTHTPVAAGFDSFSPDLVGRYFRDYLQSAGISLIQLLALGRKDPEDQNEPFNMAYLAMRGSIFVNGVSWLHGKVSRRIFQPLYPRWPEAEVPVGRITNGVHVPSWDSEAADELWTRACGKGRWLDTLENLAEGILKLSDADLWAFRTRESQRLIEYVRQRLAYQLKQRGADLERVKEAQAALGSNVLTIGFARRFTGYKRPNLLLSQPERLVAIVTNPKQPVQLIVAGKAHPDDEEGRHLVQDFVEFAEMPSVRRHIVFLEDYDLAIAQHLVEGVDLWLNTPRRPWEACGTSGMKVLVNGGLNFSELDGWWAKAYTPEVGWALGDGQEHPEPSWDLVEANQLYDLLEREIIPEFYDRNEHGIPVAWVARMRASMARLAPFFSSNRMLREYVENVYIPATNSFRQRIGRGARLAKEICGWQTALEQHWHYLRFGEVNVRAEDDRWRFEVPVYFGELDPALVSVELYADPLDWQQPVRIPMVRGERLLGALNGYVFRGEAPTERPVEHFTPRIMPAHPAASIPLEESHLLWQR